MTCVHAEVAINRDTDETRQVWIRYSIASMYCAIFIKDKIPSQDIRRSHNWMGNPMATKPDDTQRL